MRKHWLLIVLIAGACGPALVWWLFYGGREERTTAETQPRRFVSLCLPATEIICELGAGEGLVAVSADRSCPEELKHLPRVGKAFGDVNVEAVLGLEPDLVFCWKRADDVLRTRGIRTYVVETSDFEGVMRLVVEVGRIVNRSERAGGLVSAMRSRVERVETKIAAVKHRPLVYFEGGSLGRTRGPGTLTHDLIVLAGGRSIASGQSVPYPLLSAEYVIDRDPDIIIVEEYGAPPEDLRSRDGWSGLKAVRDGRVYRSPVHYTNYTPRCVGGLEQFARWFHPEVFE